MKIILGFDPGGEGRFGWAVCLDRDDGLRVVATDVADHMKKRNES